MAKQIFANTGILTRFILRRDRIRFPIWVLSLSALTVLVAEAFTNLYATAEERRLIAETMQNPAMVAMVGRGYGLANYTIGAMMAHQMLLFTALAVGVMNILLVARHTRVDEEEGRIELIRSLPTGRLSNLHATMLVLFGMNLLLALIIGFGLYALGIESMNLEGSLLYGAVLGAAGMIFAAVTAVFAQLSESSRGTIGFSFTVLGVAYLIRAMGDAGNETLSWFSPLGWVLGAEVYVNNYWWPISLTIGVAIILVMLALYLNAIRDLESGFLPSKPGRTVASNFLQGPLGLTLRLQRTGLVAWAIGMYILGASYGSVLGDLDAFFSGNEMLEKLLTPAQGFSLTEQYLTMLMSIMAMFCTIPALMAMLKLIGEEKRNRVEHLLSRVVSRTRLMGSSLIVSIAVSFFMLTCTALGLWSAATVTMENGIAFGTLYSAAMVYLPAMWIMIAVALLLVGFVPKCSSFVWMYLLYSFIVVYLGGLFQFPEWLGNLSPFGQIPKLPVEDMDFLQVSILTLIATVLTIIGFVGYNRRDIQ